MLGATGHASAQGASGIKVAGNISAPTLAATLAADTCMESWARWAYRAVVWILLCPSNLPIMGKLSPSARAREANE